MDILNVRLYDKQKDDARKLSEEGVEVWTEVPSYEAYLISNAGRLLHKRKDGSYRESKGSTANTGYILFAFFAGSTMNTRKSVVAQRAVLLAFEEGPSLDQTDARHLNGNKTDNRLCNLAWGTRSENMRDVWAHRKMALPPMPEVQEKTVWGQGYTADSYLVRVGCELHAEGVVTIEHLVRLWRCSREVASNVLRGESRQHIERPESTKQKRRPPLRKKEIRDLIAQGKTREEVNALLNETLSFQDFHYYKSKK